MSDDAILRLTGVTKVFGEGAATTQVLDKVDLEITSGKVTAVMGPSGAGKTTLLTIAGALQQPTSGEVEVLGQSIAGLSQRELAAVRRGKIGFVFQSFNLLEALNARENVQYVIELNGRDRGAKERAAELLRMVGMGHRMEAMPKQMSGGEQQRVCVARALANRGRPLILADEPTANLDSKRAEEIMALLRALSGDMGCGILLVTHDPRAQPFVDRTLWLQDGRLAVRTAGEVA